MGGERASSSAKHRNGLVPAANRSMALWWAGDTDNLISSAAIYQRLTVEPCKQPELLLLLLNMVGRCAGQQPAQVNCSRF